MLNGFFSMDGPFYKIGTLVYDLIVLNIANADMVGHTGNFDASVKAIEHIDHALKNILLAINQVEGEVIIIADHGNIEQMSIDGKPSINGRWR